jgi:soluble lytic murein transglycosylase
MFFSALSRRAPLIGLALAGAWLLAGSSALAATPNAAQRAAFKQAYASAQQGGHGWRQLAGKLHGYSLYPYLPAAAMQHDIQQIDRASVESYLAEYPDWIPAADLRRAFLLELARRQDWNGFLALYRPGLGDALSCDALQAQLAGGGKLAFERDLADLWSRANLPAACDPVLTAAHDQGLLTDARLWTRIDRAADAGQAGTIASLADWLPASDRGTALQLALALRDPAGAVAAAANWPDGMRQRQAVTLALTRLARPIPRGSNCSRASR